MRIGVAGAGALGFHHVRILRELCGAAFVGFHEPEAERAAKVSSELGVTAHATLDGLLDACDAVSIAAATTAHCAVGMAAIARGRHLFIEKPITATLAEADALLAAAAARGLVVQVGHVERVNRAVRAAWPMLDGPRYIEATRFAPFTARGADVSVVLDLMVHDLDLVLGMVGAPVSRVDALGAAVLAPTVDLANARITFANGAVAQLSASRVAGARERRMRIVQPSGLLALDLAAGTGTFHRLRADVDRSALARSKTPVDPASFTESIALEAPEGEPLRLEFEAWLATLRGDGPMLVSGAQGRAVLAAAFDIMAAIERGAAAGA